jgi:hypothetical protein
MWEPPNWKLQILNYKNIGYQIIENSLLGYMS